jgi:hypothetical protein
LAMNCAPSVAMVRKSSSAPLSMNVTSLRSTTHVRPLRVRVEVLQMALSSLTQGPNTRPCSTHRVSAAVSAIEILSTFLPQMFKYMLRIETRDDKMRAFP